MNGFKLKLTKKEVFLKHLLLILASTITLESNAATITIGSANPISLCPGQTINVPFTTSEAFMPGNIFTVQLSDAAGGFANAVDIGSSGGTVSGAVIGIIPGNTMAGAVYRVRIVSTNPTVTSSINSSNINIKPVPALISVTNNGPNCTGTSITLTANTGLFGTSYTWTGPNSFASNAQIAQVTNLTLASAGTYTVIANLDGCLSAPGTTTLSVIQSSVPTIIISTPTTSVCEGSPVTFSATITNGGTTPAYRWRRNGNNITGASAETYTTSSIASGDIISCVLTSSMTCASPANVNSAPLNMTAKTVPVAPSASHNAPVCDGMSINLTATTVAASTYEWAGPGGFNSTQQNPSRANADASMAGVYTVTAVRAGCVSAPASTTVAVYPYVTPAVSIVSNYDTICIGSPVHFTATPVNGGTVPSYQWKRNNVVQTTNTTGGYSISALANGDSVSCVMTSNAFCKTVASASSNAIPIVVKAKQTPAISITSSQNPCCAGANVTFTSNVINGGISPVYAWRKNSVSIPGANAASFTSNMLSSSDKIQCVLTSSEGCVTTAQAGSNVITQDVNPLAKPSVILQPSTLLPGSTVNFSAYPTNAGPTPAYTFIVDDQPVITNMTGNYSWTLAKMSWH